MIARIRRGNDFHVAWQIKRGGVAENLENVTDIKLERTIYGVTTEHTLFTVSGDTITAEIPAEVQTHNGQYKLTLSYELVDTGMSDDDRKCKVAIYAFAIVDPLGPADDLLTVNVSSDVTIGLKGDKGLSAYQVWLENGNVGTEDDYFAYLRQPATDAATTANTAAGDANDAATAANTAAGLANNAATTANTAAAEADTARLAIQDDLASKADQTELDQLAGDVDQLALTTVPIDAIGGEAITSETNLLASLVGTDIDDSNIWGSGYFLSNGVIASATTVRYSKDYIRAFKGSYNAWIAISTIYSIVIYDKEKNVIGSVQNNTTPLAYQFSFDLPEGTAYIRISHIRAQSTNNLKLYPVDVVYSFDNSIFEPKRDDIEVGTNLLSEINTSLFADTDIWESGFLLGDGRIAESVSGYYSKKYYKVTEGSYNLKAFIYGNAACVLYDGSFNVISSFKTDEGVFDEPIIIPDNAVYIRISHLSGEYNIKNIKLTNTIPVVFQDNKILSNIGKGNYDYAVNGEAVASHELEMIKRANPPKKMFPIVSFISDDGHIDNINWYIPILEEHDVKSTFVAISTWNDGDYMTTEQLKDLHNKGHEIGGHSKTHAQLSNIPIDDAEEEIRHSALYLIDMGIEPYTFVHPFGSRNLDTDRLVREHFKISLIVTSDSTVAEGTCCNTPPIDAYGVKRLSFDSFQTYDSRLQLAKDAVDVAVTNNQWLIFIIHPQYDEYNTANPNYLSKRQDVSDLISYIKQQGARILTCKDAMHYYGNSFEVGNKRLDDIYYALGSDGNDEGNFFDRRK